MKKTQLWILSKWSQNQNVQVIIYSLNNLIIETEDALHFIYCCLMHIVDLNWSKNNYFLFILDWLRNFRHTDVFQMFSYKVIFSFQVISAKWSFL